MTNAARIKKMESILKDAFEPVELEIHDDSHKHIGHAGAKDGRGHFSLRIVSEKFEGLNAVQRHRLIYQALGDLMKTDIHALSIDAQ